jgi:adenosylhomocysteine nucleosidase
MSSAMADRNAPADQEKPILVTFAVKEEMKFFTGRPGIRRFITGMGRDNAERNGSAALDQIQPRLVLTCGYAGGLNPALKNNEVIFHADPGTQLYSKLEEMGATSVNFFCTRRVAITSEEKVRLWRGTGLDAVEMESESIRDLCRERNIPSATIRVISDSSEEDLPLDFNTLMTPTQKIHYGKLGWALLRSPLKLMDLLAFQQKTIDAAKALADYLNRLFESGSLNDEAR